MIRNLYEVLSEADAKPKAKSKDKPKAKPIPHEEPILVVKLVDGKKTRDTIAVDFIGGGHSLVYPVIPKGEVWIEQELAPDEQVDILVHELIEFALMSKGGLTYTPAHNMANKLEKVFRGFEGRWKTKQAPGGDKKVEEGLIAESYNRALPSFIKYLKGGVDPYDFSHMLNDFFEEEGIDKPEGYDEDYSCEFLERPEFDEYKDQFIKWLGDKLSSNMSGADAYAPTYLFMTGAKLVPRQTWLIHFSNDADDIARNGFQYGAEDYTALGLTTHFSDKVRKKGPGWNFAFTADDRDVRTGSKKYGKQAVMFQSAGVEAFHDGDNESQVVFWGPNVKERFLIQNDGGGWVVKNPTTDKELVRSENIFDVIGWVKQNHAQYNKVITNDQKAKPIQPTPKADREKLLAKPPEKTPQPFEAVTEDASNFKAWFGKSKVVDDQQKPLKVYHGARGHFKSFKGNIFWFSESTGLSNIYAMNDKDSYDTKSSIVPVFLSITNPIDLVGKCTADDYLTKTEFYKLVGLEAPSDIEYALDRSKGFNNPVRVEKKYAANQIINDPAFISAAKTAGYDGVKIEENDTSGKVNKQSITWATFSPNQAKSAIGNKGTFNPKSLKLSEAEIENPKGVCLKCGLQKHSAIPHLCPKGRSKWGAKGGKFTTPERPRFKEKIAESTEEDLLVIVKQYASNKHPDDHVPEDYHWAREKAFNTEGLIHMMPGGLAGWRSFLGDAAKGEPEKYGKLAKTEKIDDPVILSPGHIWDGWHRIAAAIVNGHKTIPAIVGKLNAR